MNDLGGKADGTGSGHSMADKVVDEIEQAGGSGDLQPRLGLDPGRRRGGRPLRGRRLRQGRHRHQQRGHPPRQDLREARAGGPRGGDRRPSEGRLRRPAARVPGDEGERVRAVRIHVVRRGDLRQLRTDATTAPPRWGSSVSCNVLSVEGAAYNIRSNAIAPTGAHPHDRGAARPDRRVPLSGDGHSARDVLSSEACEADPRDLLGRRRRASRSIFVGLTPGWIAGKGRS